MNHPLLSGRSAHLCFLLIPLLLTLALPHRTAAQRVQAQNGQKTTCFIKRNSQGIAADPLSDKQGRSRNGAKKKQAKASEQTTETEQNHLLTPNQIGYFPQVASIVPGESVPIEITYPEGMVGEKVAILVQDGGTLDNGKRVKVMPIDEQKRIAFHFQVTNSRGLYRVTLRKGNDTKVVRLWVGSEPSAAQN